jgi:hypothetical protein
LSDVHAEHAPEALMDPAISWGTLGAHVVAAQRALAGGVVYHPLGLAKLLTQDSGWPDVRVCDVLEGGKGDGLCQDRRVKRKNDRGGRRVDL